MEGVRKRPADLGQELKLGHRQGGLAPLRPHRHTAHADDVTEIGVDLPDLLGLDEQLNPTAAVDEVEEDQLPHVAPSHDAAGDREVLVQGLAWLGSLGLLADH